MDPHIRLKERIEEYLKMMDKVEPIINKVRNQNKSLIDIKDIDNMEKCMIATKIKLLQDKSEYLKRKSIFEAAVKDYMEKKLSGKETSIKEIAELYGIGPSTLREEMQRRHSLGEKYQYDRTIKTGRIKITYQEEKSLLESLKLQFTNIGQQLQPCSCRTCFLLKLSTFAYEFAISNKVTYLPLWKVTKQVDIIWLKEFEMRNSCEISTFCSENCTL